MKHSVQSLVQEIFVQIFFSSPQTHFYPYPMAIFQEFFNLFGPHFQIVKRCAEAYLDSFTPVSGLSWPRLSVFSAVGKGICPNPLSWPRAAGRRGDISIKSKFASCALTSASALAKTPKFSPSGPLPSTPSHYLIIYSWLFNKYYSTQFI